MSEPILYDIDTLRDFCAGLLIKTGITAKHADIISDTIIFAELRDIKSHGLIRIPTYIERIEHGVVNSKPNMKFVKNKGAISLMDADNGPGQVAGYIAMETAIDLARLYGIGVVAVKNSNHFGVASYYSLMASDKDMIGVAMTNASPAIAPYGTKIPLLGTNPISVSIPAKEKKPIVLDMSMSTVARGKLRIAAMKNQQIPLDWGLDEDGNPTSDPNKALKGSLQPIGGVKGSGLSLVVDILCGVLSGSSLTGEVKNITDMSGPSKTGHMFMAINISSFTDKESFKKDIDTVISLIKSLPPRGDNEIFVAGEIEFNVMEKRKNEGIPVDEKIINSLNLLADKYGVSRL